MEYHLPSTNYYYITPKGDGNSVRMKIMGLPQSNYYYITPKGDGNMSTASSVIGALIIYLYITPARGLTKFLKTGGAHEFSVCQ